MDPTEEVSTTSSPEDGKRSSFWNTVFFRISDKFQKPNNPMCYDPSVSKIKPTPVTDM
jgi:hypothetical protein